MEGVGPSCSRCWASGRRLQEPPAGVLGLPRTRGSRVHTHRTAAFISLKSKFPHVLVPQHQTSFSWFCLRPVWTWGFWGWMLLPAASLCWKKGRHSQRHGWGPLRGCVGPGRQQDAQQRAGPGGGDIRMLTLQPLCPPIPLGCLVLPQPHAHTMPPPASLPRQRPHLGPGTFTVSPLCHCPGSSFPGNLRTRATQHLAQICCLVNACGPALSTQGTRKPVLLGPRGPQGLQTEMGSTDPLRRDKGEGEELGLCALPTPAQVRSG